MNTVPEVGIPVNGGWQPATEAIWEGLSILAARGEIQGVEALVATPRGYERVTLRTDAKRFGDRFEPGEITRIPDCRKSSAYVALGDLYLSPTQIAAALAVIEDRNRRRQAVLLAIQAWEAHHHYGSGTLGSHWGRGYGDGRVSR